MQENNVQGFTHCSTGCRILRLATLSLKAIGVHGVKSEPIDFGATSARL